MLQIAMSENPYQPPHAHDIGATSRRPRLWLQPLGLMIVAFAAFLAHALATKVPAGELQISTAPWVAKIMMLASVSVFALCGVLMQQCRRLNTRAELLYLLSPLGMFGYFGYRLWAG